MNNFGFIGCGNMASAIINGVINSGTLDAKQITAYDINKNATGNMLKNHAINIATDIEELCAKSDFIVLAIKPHFFSQVLSENNKFFAGKKIISIAAGISYNDLVEMLPKTCNILRVMPNTPALVSQGVTALCDNTSFDNESKQIAFDIFSCLGYAFWIDEKFIDGVIGVSGSGPAYCFMFIEALADAGVREGLTRDLAYTLAAQTLKGSAEMVLKTKEHPAKLKDNVCSPGGTTIEAVYHLENSGFRSAVQNAVRFCAQKSRDMSKK